MPARDFQCLAGAHYMNDLTNPQSLVGVCLIRARAVERVAVACWLLDACKKDFESVSVYAWPSEARPVYGPDKTVQEVDEQQRQRRC